MQARLLTTNRIADTDTIEVSHEALIAVWERLAVWLQEARGAVEFQKAISADAADCQRHGQRPDDLYRGARLLEAQDWAKNNLPSADEQRFIDTSADEQARRQEVERKIARQVQNFRRASVVLALFVVLALIAAGLAAL